MSDQLASPLHWPLSWPRTASHARENGAFKGTFDQVRRELVYEVTQIALGASARYYVLNSIVISTNLPLRKDGYPSASAPRPVDPGVAVYFERKKQPVCFACDKYNEVWKNMRAITKTIEAMRGIERWGSTQLLDRAFTGFTALPEKTQASCWEVLGIKPPDRLDLALSEQRGGYMEREILDAYRRKARETHPDKEGGSSEAFARVVAAKDMALQLIQ